MTDLTPAPEPLQPIRADDRLRRLQFGIAGLVGVLLLVGLAGMISDRANPDDAAAAAAAGVKAGAPTAAPDDPLAELGVQPAAPEEATKAAPTNAVPVDVRDGAVPDLQPDPVLQRARDAAKK
ncbi:MAG: hypothetical protein RLZZ58_676 [Pseudomonadota bacterium]|jgi:predicted lipid-binding transport protein (Tim44 family)